MLASASSRGTLFDVRGQLWADEAPPHGVEELVFKLASLPDSATDTAAMWLGVPA